MFNVVQSKLFAQGFDTREAAFAECRRAAHAAITNAETQFVGVKQGDDALPIGCYVVDRRGPAGGDAIATFEVVETVPPLKLIDYVTELHGMGLDVFAEYLLLARRGRHRYVRLIPMNDAGTRGAVVIWEGEEHVLDSELRELIEKEK